MEFKKLFFVLICIFLLLFSFSAFAQRKGKGMRWDGSGGWGLNSKY